MSDVVEVAAAVLRERGQILLSQRPADKHQGGRWEFPGGKCEPGESLEQALERELFEELGLRLHGSRPFMTIAYNYPDRCVRLHFREVLDWAGTPEGREGQPFDWFSPAELAGLALPPANEPLVAALNLPESWAIVPDTPDERAIIAALPGLARAGRGVYLRGLENTPDQLRSLVAHCHRWSLPVMIRNDADQALRLGAQVLHLSAQTAARLQTRPDFGGYVSVACHNHAELEQARCLGADQVLVSPVAATPGHPDAEPLGWSGLAELVEGQPLPVYALGGVRPDDRDQARAAGARGVAGIRAFWGEREPSEGES